MTTNRRLSLPASFESEGDSSRMDEKGPPRYLQASPGSCHDLCKYGKHSHKLEKNDKKAFPKKTSNSDQIPSVKKPPQTAKTKPLNTPRVPLSKTITPIKSIPTKKSPPLHPKDPKPSSNAITPSTHSSKRSKKPSSQYPSSSPSSRRSLPSNLPEEKTLYEVTDDKVAKNLTKEFSDSPAKMVLKKEKLVETSPENKGPRRLQFRRGKVVDCEEVIKGVKLKFKRGLSEKDSGEEIETEKVVLRHQDVQGKKDSQGLFNNVIEETASKLVETRKSKVKALVGAFETVISLQDGSNIVH